MSTKVQQGLLFGKVTLVSHKIIRLSQVQVKSRTALIRTRIVSSGIGPIPSLTRNPPSRLPS